MITAGQYLRLALLLPILLPALFIVILLGVLNLAFGSSDPVSRPPGIGEFLREIAVNGTRLGVWPAYAIWCLGFLAWTARFPADRVRRALWWGPLAFGPLAGIAWAVAQPIIGRVRPLDDTIIGGTVVAVVFTGIGYIFVVVALALEQLGISKKLIRRPAPNAISPGV